MLHLLYYPSHWRLSVILVLLSYPSYHWLCLKSKFCYVIAVTELLKTCAYNSIRIPIVKSLLCTWELLRNILEFPFVKRIPVLQIWWNGLVKFQYIAKREKEIEYITRKTSLFGQWLMFALRLEDFKKRNDEKSWSSNLPLTTPFK